MNICLMYVYYVGASAVSKSAVVVGLDFQRKFCKVVNGIWEKIVAFSASRVSVLRGQAGVGGKIDWVAV